jgi:hypothetical protein
MRSYAIMLLVATATLMVFRESCAQDCTIQAFGTVTQAKERILAGDSTGAKDLLEGAHEQCPTSAQVARAIADTYRTMNDDSDAGFYANLADQLEGKPQAAANQGFSGKISRAASPALEPMSDVDRFILSKSPTSPVPNRWAVLVGVEHYSNKDIPAATYAERDAMAMREYFVKLMGVPKSQTYLLTGDHATRTDIKELLEVDLPSRIKLAGAGQEVFFYYSGHGAPSESGSFLLPFDGNPRSLAETAISVSKLYDDLNNLGAKSEVAFLDACFTGNATRTGSVETLLPGTRAAPWIGPEPSVPATVIAFTAAGKNQDSNAYKDESHGLFTYFLLRGLQGKGSGSDLFDLSREVTVQVEEKAGELFGNALTQTPKLIGSGSDARRLILVPR